MGQAQVLNRIVNYLRTTGAKIIKVVPQPEEISIESPVIIEDHETGLIGVIIPTQQNPIIITNKGFTYVGSKIGEKHLFRGYATRNELVLMELFLLLGDLDERVNAIIEQISLETGVMVSTIEKRLRDLGWMKSEEEVAA
jgi:hypothetical protein